MGYPPKLNIFSCALMCVRMLLIARPNSSSGWGESTAGLSLVTRTLFVASKDPTEEPIKLFGMFQTLRYHRLFQTYSNCIAERVGLSTLATLNAKP